MTKAQVQLVLHRNGPEGNFLLLYLESSEVKKWNQYFYFYYSAYNSTRVKKALTFATSGNADEKKTNQEKKECRISRFPHSGLENGTLKKKVERCSFTLAVALHFKPLSLIRFLSASR